MYAAVTKGKVMILSGTGINTEAKYYVHGLEWFRPLQTKADFILKLYENLLSFCGTNTVANF